MATQAEVEAKIQALEDALAQFDGAADFRSQGAGGSLEVINTDRAVARMEKSLAFWRRRLWVIKGGKCAEPTRVGIDSQRRTSNNDEAGG